MNFFDHQERARRQSTRLVFLFVLATLGIVLAANAVVLALVAFFGQDRYEPAVAFLPWLRDHIDIVVITSLVTASAIGLVSFLKILSLGSGGGAVARALGGTLVPPDVQDPSRRRLRNVVEEISLAAGVPVPEIYVLENEPGINAFAAGYHPGDAAVAVTRGTLDLLDRDELQGVIAHEYSHIFNGDMRLNMRLMGGLFGIVSVYYLGRIILRASSEVRGSGRDGAAGVLAIFLAGLAFVVIGALGMFFGNLIKAAVSRQREFLADASAVQFTRSPQGIAGALKKIAALGRGGQLDAARAEEASHMLFADGRRALDAWFATHPPLVDRIKAIEPQFDAQRELPRIAVGLQKRALAPMPDNTGTSVSGFAAPRDASLPIDPDVVTAAVGSLQDADLRDAQALHAAIPAEVLDAAHSRNEVVAVVLGMILDGETSIRLRQLELIEERFSIAARARIDALGWEIAGLGPSFRLPVLELAFPALKSRPVEQLKALSQLVVELSDVDSRIDVFEYVLAKLMRVYVLEASRPGVAARARDDVKLYHCRSALQVVFSCLARFGHAEPRAARLAYEAGMRDLFPNQAPEYSPPFHWPPAMDRALDELDRLAPLMKEILVGAMTKTISHDGRVTVSELELLRAVCAVLHCPLPPFTGLVRSVTAR